MRLLCIGDLQMLVNVIEFIKSIYRPNSKATALHCDICAKHSKWNRLILKILLAAYFGAGLGYQIPSFVHLAITGEFRPPFGIYLPGLDTEEWTHCLILFLFNNMFLLIGAPIVAAFDAFISIMFHNMFTVSRTIVNYIDELGTMLADESISKEEIKSKLIAIMQIHVDYNA